jgi:hypothetical protein
MDEDEPNLPEKLRFKLIIKLREGTQLPASWVTVSDVSFEGLAESVKQCIITAHEEHGEDSNIEDRDFSMAYKASTANGLGTTIRTNDDFLCFCEEYQEFIKNKKTVSINTVLLGNQSHVSHKRKSTKQVSAFY